MIPVIPPSMIDHEKMERIEEAKRQEQDRIRLEPVIELLQISTRGIFQDGYFTITNEQFKDEPVIEIKQDSQHLLDIYIDFPRLYYLICNVSDSSLQKSFKEIFARWCNDISEAGNDIEDVLIRMRKCRIIRYEYPSGINPVLVYSVINPFTIETEEFLDTARTNSKTKSWIGAVKLRDGFICKKCGSDIKLHAHHIIPVNVDPLLAWDINNGITLCSRCHIDFHSRYGSKEEIGHFQIHEFLKGA
jgi:hypothetical protein